MKNIITHINFTNLDIEQKKIILSWRNNENIKKWMFNDKNISMQSHLQFITSLEYSHDKKYFLLKNDNVNIGIVNFTKINNRRAYLGLYANYKLKGMGILLLNFICDYGFNTLKLTTLYAEVFANNEKAIKLYNKFNFKESSKKTINNKEVILMELTNENW